MYARVNKSKGNKSKAPANSVTQKKSNVKQGLGFVDNRPETVVPRKLQEMANSYTTQKQTPFIQLKELGVMQLRGKRKGKGKFSTVGASPAASAVTNMFIQQHMGNQAAARQTAQNRAGSGIAASHTIDLTETAGLLSEMQHRITSGYYIPGNQVMSPYAGGMQYLTGKSYKIWETKFDNKGRLKKTKMINKQFYYDVLGIAGNALHHFDGPA